MTTYIIDLTFLRALAASQNDCASATFYKGKQKVPFVSVI